MSSFFFKGKNNTWSGRIWEVARRFVRFASVGGITTTYSQALNFILLKFFNTALIPTYTLIYISAIALSYTLNSLFTFKSRLEWRTLFAYYGVYLSSMLLGIGLLMLFSKIFSFENWVYPFMALPFTMTWNFIFASKFMKGE